METDKKAKTRWDKADISFQNYQKYLFEKEDRFKLTLIDLLYISNFKGGNATINEPVEKIQTKLLPYSNVLSEIAKEFDGKSLEKLNKRELDLLLNLTKKACNLTEKGSRTKIDGFSISYLSALMCSFFPNLIPVLDRRVLINLQLASENDLYKNGQVKDIEQFYPDLIRKMHTECTRLEKNLRELDEALFSQKLGTK